MKYLIILGRDLAQCLGLSYLHRKSGDLFTNLKKNNGGYRGIRTEEQIHLLVQSAIARYMLTRYRVTLSELPFQSTGDIAIYSDSKLVLDLNLPPRKIQLYPDELYVFLNIVKPWPVMGQYRQLLKIVPLKQGEDHENITINFYRPEYHALTELHPRLLNFQISTVEGALIEPFDENYKMYMNLQFSYN